MRTDASSSGSLEREVDRGPMGAGGKSNGVTHTGTFIAAYCLAVLLDSRAVEGAGSPGAELRAEPALAALRAHSPGVRAHAVAGRVTRVYGARMSFGATVRTSAGAFITQHAGVFGAQPEDLAPIDPRRGRTFAQPVMYDRATGTYKYTLLSYGQRRNGIPVHGSELRVLLHNGDGCPLVLAVSSLRDLGDFRPEAADPAAAREMSKAVRADLANAAVVTRAGETDFAGQPMPVLAPGLINFNEHELVIWAGVGDAVVDPVVAVSYIADNYGNPLALQPQRWLFVADLETGEILHLENLIRFVDMTGSVGGMVTQGHVAMECAEETYTPFPFAEVSILNGNSAFADQVGNFVIPNDGSSWRTVESLNGGLWFDVHHHTGSDERLTALAAPPGPVNFVHNAVNTGEQVRAQANAYAEANEVRNWVLSVNPAYPGLGGDTDFPVYVNRIDGVCPGNAWYDGLSLNFCEAGGGKANTAFGSVVQHEYGHHVVSSGGSDQGAYGEGMSDCIAMLIADDPGLAYGFYYAQCNTPLRDADNDCQYSESSCSDCGSESHDCGRLLSGAVWTVRSALAASHPVDYLQILSDLTVNSILMHVDDAITPQLTIDFLTLDDAPPAGDLDISNGTPHAGAICGGFRAHGLGDFCDDLPAIGFVYPSGWPDIIAPGEPATFGINAVPLNGTPVPGTGELHYRLTGEAWRIQSLTEPHSNEYVAALPAADCGSKYEWYVSAEAVGAGAITDPAGAPDEVHVSQVADGYAVLFEDDFETDKGWSVTGDAAGGHWERGVPVSCARGDPPVDHDGSGRCYLTENDPATCNSDVDTGYTYLDSPVLDLGDGDARVNYALWYTNYFGYDPHNDVFRVLVSNNSGADWVPVDTVGPTSAVGWRTYSFTVGDFVPPTDQVKIRFEASDQGESSVVEAGVDSVAVLRPMCYVPGEGDFDADGDVDVYDYEAFAACFTGQGAGPIEPACTPGDSDSDEDVDCADWTSFVQRWTEPGPPPALAECPLSIPALSAWGTATMALLMLTAGTVVVQRRSMRQTRCS